MPENKILAKDCSPIEGAVLDSQISQKLLEFSLLEKSCFKAHLNGIAENDDSPIVSFDFNSKQWWAGRYIGNASIPGKKTYEVEILPRFGDKILVELLGEAYHFKLTEDQYRTSDPNNRLTIKNLMAVIWFAKLERSSRYGLPRVSASESRSSQYIRGRIDIPGTIRRHPQLNKVVTRVHYKMPDILVVEIIRRAQKEIGLHIIGKGALVSDTVQEMLNNLSAIPAWDRPITDYDYNSIRYHPIYARFKEIVDFSWQILKGSWAERQSENGQRTIGYFLDMAELWELYIRSKLVGILAGTGYTIIPSKYETYAGRFFGRHLIPDIVFEREGSYIVFDAKYKSMGQERRAIDLDREDFFQIHSYMSYLGSKGKVKIGGLIYPCKSCALFDSGPTWGNQVTNFIIGGPRVEHGFEIDWKEFRDRLLEASK